MRTQESHSVCLHIIHTHTYTSLLISSPGQVGKTLGERWKALNEKQRVPYEAKAVADKKRYEDAKAAYNVSTYVPLDPHQCTNSNAQAEPAEEEEEESS